MAGLVEIKRVEPNQDLVKQMEAMLEQAKSGELQGWIGVAIFDDGTVDDCWMEPPKHYHISILSDRVVGCLHRAAFRLLNIRWGDVENA